MVRTFDRHTLRRESGIPTLGVFSWQGKDWQHRLDSEGFAPVLVCRGPLPASRWLSSLRRDEIVEALSLPGSPHTTDYELQLAVERLGLREGMEEPLLELLAGRVPDSEAPARRLVRMLSPRLQRGRNRPIQIDAWSDTDARPALEALAKLCFECPSLPVSAVLPPSAVQGLLDSPPTKLVTMVREGLVPEPSGAEREAKLRSEAEALLFQRLETRSGTRGLFLSNQKLPILHGSREMEVDLICHRLKLAIEIDGWHHFQQQANYRRDRSKDVKLQLNGYLVFRVLADDVMKRPVTAVNQIEELVQQRSNPK